MSIILLTLGLATAAFLALRRLSFLRVLKNPLAFSPLDLTVVDLTWIMALMLLKQLPFPFGFRKSLKPNKKGGIALPALGVSAPMTISLGYIHAFKGAVKRRVPQGRNRPAESAETFASEQARKDADQTVSPMFVVAATTPMLLLLLAQPKCPIRPLGAVNTRNRFEWLRPDLCRSVEALTEQKWVVEARMGGDEGAGVRLKRGVEVKVVIEMFTAPPVVQQGRGRGRGEASECVFRQEFYFLQNLPTGHKPLWKDPGALGTQTVAVPSGSGGPDTPLRRSGRVAAAAAAAKEVLVTDAISWDVRAPWRYAAVCKDYNPIHVSPFLAKNVFGFPGAVMYGNLVVALVVDRATGRGQWRPDRAVEDEAARDVEAKAGELWWAGDAQVWMEVGFRKPMEVPGGMDVKWVDGGAAGEVVGFEVQKEGKLYLSGRTGYI
jgi:hypothetical protein